MTEHKSDCAYELCRKRFPDGWACACTCGADKPTPPVETAKWTSGKPQVATDKDCGTRWGCGKPGELFRCAFCGHKFNVGDYWRWVFTNDIPGAGGNPFICKDCDGPDARERWKSKCAEWKRATSAEFWFFNRRLYD